jgi:hypothetical protein
MDSAHKYMSQSFLDKPNMHQRFSSLSVCHVRVSPHAFTLEKKSDIGMNLS